MWAGALLMAAMGCQAAVETPPPDVEMTCDSPVATDLGVPTVRRPALLTTSGGTHRFVVTALPPGSIVGEIDGTEVQLSAPDAPGPASLRVWTSPQQPGVVDVPAGTYRVINTNRGSIEVEVCSDVTLADVKAAVPVG